MSESATSLKPFWEVNFHMSVDLKRHSPVEGMCFMLRSGWFLKNYRLVAVSFWDVEGPLR